MSRKEARNRGDNEDRRGHDLSPVAALLAAERVEAHHGGLFIVTLEERRGDQEFIPGVEAQN
jgi:hypothetical protein